MITGKPSNLAAEDAAQPSQDESMKPQSAASGRARITRSMSAPVIELKAMVNKRLANQLQVLFDKVDDALFDMAESAASNQQQNNFFESMRDVRFKRVDIEKRFLDGLQDDFVALFSDSASGDDSVERAAELSGAADEDSSLSLMEEDVVEEMVAIDTMVSRYEKALALPLEALDARLAHLAGIEAELVHSGERANPLSPKRWCHNFSEATRVLSIDIKARIVVFKLFEKAVLAELPEVCKLANEKLIRAKVLPNYRAGAQRAANAEGINSSYPNNGQTTEVGRVLGGGRRVHSQRAQEFSQLLNYMPDYDAGLNSLWQAAGGDAFSTQNAALPVALSGAINGIASSVGPVVSGDSLITLLDNLQHHGELQGSLGGGDGSSLPTLLRPEAVISSIGTALSGATQSGQYSLARRERDVISLVSLLFHFVLEDRGVPEPMRIVISRLQIPVIKLALQDDEFFCNGAHPARRLMNELTQATIGWNESEDYHKDPLYQAICGIVDRVLAEFDQDQAIFSELLADLKSMLSGEDKKAELREKRLVDAEMGRDASERAREQVAALLEQKLVPGLPEFVSNMVTMVWNNLLFLAYVQHGENSDEWNEAQQTLTTLLWSVSPERYKEDRAEILKALPELLKSIGQGFEQVNCNKQASTAFFSELEKLHMQIMQRSGPLPVEQQPDSVSVSELNETEDAAGDTDTAEHQRADRASDAETAGQQPAEAQACQEECSHEGTQEDSDTESGRESIADSAIVPNEYLEKAGSLSVGQWVELHQDGNKKRCRLVAILRNNGKRIFVNRSGAKACEFQVAELARLIMSGKIVLLEDAQLFDKALTSIISGLRKQKNAFGE